MFANMFSFQVIITQRSHHKEFDDDYNDDVEANVKREKKQIWING